MEHFTFSWELLHTAMEALSSKPHPETTLLKAYFLFAKHEGYPVMQQWLTTLPKQTREEVSRILQSPVEACGVDTSIVDGYIRSLESYFLQSTDLILPDG
jgi:hypothetical protein